MAGRMQAQTGVSKVVSERTLPEMLASFHRGRVTEAGPITCPTCQTVVDPAARCPSERGAARCMERAGHPGFHWSDVGASPAVLVWSGSYTGRRCPGRLDLNRWCVKTPGHERGHNDGRGLTWHEDDQWDEGA